MRVGARASAGAALAVVAALVLVLASCGHGGPATGSARGQAPAGAPPAAIAARGASARHADPFAGPAAAYVAGRAGTALAAVYDLTTGQSWRLGDGPAQDEASLVKLDILEALLAAHGGTGLPAADQALAQAMIEDSDNDAATSLWDKAGGAAGLSAYNVAAGLTRTIPSPCVTCAGFAWPGWGLSTTVPYDQIMLLKQLIEPGLLPAAGRSYALSLMEHVARDQAWGVSGGVPAGARVALKNGWLPLDGANSDWQVNSVGWVSGDGRDYLIAVLTTGNPTEKYGIVTISALSSLVWTAMR